MLYFIASQSQFESQTFVYFDYFGGQMQQSLMTTTKQRRETQQAKNDQKLIEKTVLHRIKNLPLTLFWSATLAIGGLLLLSFFASIEFIPEFDLQSISVVMAACAAIAIFITALLGFGFLTPAFIQLSGKQSSPQMLASQLGIALIVAIVIIAPISLGDHGKLFSALFFVSAWLMGYKFKKAPIFESRFNLEWFGVLLLHLVEIAFFIVWAVVLISILSFTFQEAGEADTRVAILVSCVITTLFAAFAAIVRIVRPERKLRFSIGLGLASVAVLSLFLDQPTLIPKKALALIGLSTPERNATLVLTQTGCATVETVHTGLCRFDENAKLGIVRNARIISRIGTQIILHVGLPPNPEFETNPLAAASKISKSESQLWQRFILDKSEVKGLSYSAPLSATEIKDSISAKKRPAP